MTSTGETAAMTAGAIVEEAWGLLRRHPRELALPLMGLGALFFGFLHHPGHYVERALNDLDYAYGFPFGVLEALWDLVEVVVGLGSGPLAVLLALATARAAFMPYLGEGAPDANLARQAVSAVYFPALLVLAPVAFVTSFAMVPIVPGTLIAAALLPLVAVIVAEDARGLSGLRRAWSLVREHPGTAVLVVLPGLGIGLVGAIVLTEVPYVSDLLLGVALGLALSYYFVLSTVWYARVTGMPSPVVGAAPTVTSRSDAPPPAADPRGTTGGPVGAAPAPAASGEDAPDATARTRT